ncbi:unnamed protein product [Lactuca virosa]|uniref:Reverse transcriptase zinc-binding domain-containing protein n=1 Tax=Lactuca virosa TaxID=75947 RepID=A0AAU9NID6_9ASTR|nr:unnamed protein product [Lactuca virosa]
MIRVRNNIVGIKRELERKGISHAKSRKIRMRLVYCGSAISLGVGKYKVSALPHILEDNGPVHIAKFSWIKEILLKVLCFIWKAKGGRIPLAAALTKRGINLQTTTCCQCDSMEETTDHILVQCAFARTVMEWIFK